MVLTSFLVSLAWSALIVVITYLVMKSQSEVSGIMAYAISFLLRLVGLAGFGFYVLQNDPGSIEPANGIRESSMLAFFGGLVMGGIADIYVILKALASFQGSENKATVNRDA